MLNDKETVRKLAYAAVVLPEEFFRERKYALLPLQLPRRLF